MHFKTYLTALLLCLAGVLTAHEQISTQLVQVTKESQIVSGRAYKLYYVSNQAVGCFVKAESDKFSMSNGSTYDGEDADYIFIKESDN